MMLSPGWRAHTCLKLMAGCAVCESDSSWSKEQEEEERPGEMHKDLSRRRRISRAGITVGRRKRRKRRRRRVRRGGGRGEERKRRRRQREKRYQDLPVSLTAVCEVLQNNNPLCSIRMIAMPASFSCCSDSFCQQQVGGHSSRCSPVRVCHERDVRC